MVFTAQEALREGLGLTNPDPVALQKAYEHLMRRVAAAVKRKTEEVMLVLELTPHKPVEFSAGEYEYRRRTGILTVCIMQGLTSGETAMIFCREIAEFLQRQEVGYCITHELWSRWGPALYQELMSFFDVQGG